MGFLVEDEESALMWRGLMLNRGVTHFLQDVDWGDDLDYLFIDMPPGTGDVQMGVAKLLPRAEVIVVTTPATAAQKVAVRAVSMARKSYLRVAGVIENMSSFTCEHGTTYSLFGEGGGAALAADAGIPLLGQVPLEASVAAGGDAGEPAVLGDGPAAEAFRAIADRILTEAIPPAELAGCSARDARRRRCRARRTRRGQTAADATARDRSPLVQVAPRAIGVRAAGPALGGQLAKVGPHRAGRHRVELLAHVGVEVGDDRLDRRRARPLEQVEDLRLAGEAVGDVLVDAGHRVLDEVAVTGSDRLELSPQGPQPLE